MKVLAIVDYSFLYYKYMFQLDSGKLKRLTTRQFDQDDEGNTFEYDKDISNIYYSIREVESFRKKLEAAGHDVTMAVCFDMPSSRKGAAVDSSTSPTESSLASANYKSTRVKRLTDQDFKDIQLVSKILAQAGHNTYRIKDFEADDLVAELVRKYSDDFDGTVIYTPDADLLVNIREGVVVQRYKQTKGYTCVGVPNFSDYLSAELKCKMPYNALMLFKATCGDKSDDIAGIRGFGPKAFDRLIDYCENTMGIVWEECGDYESNLRILERCGGYLSADAVEQAIASLSMVRPMIPDDGMVEAPTIRTDADKRIAAYMPYNMASLCK